MTERVGTVIVGGGIAGCAVAHYLAEEGETGILLVEADELGSGSTGGSFGGVRQQFSTALEIELSRRGLEFWRTAERVFDSPVAWHPNGLGAGLAGLGDELLAVETAWRQRARASLRFTVSSYQSSDLVANPVAIAQEPDGRIVAFTTFRPTGRDNGWVLDLLRRVPGSVPGAVESCLVEAAFGLRSLGASTLSLGLAPLAGLDPRQGFPVERVLGLGVRMIRHTYDVAGLYFFKAKFDPRWEPRYLVVARRAHLPSVILALLRLHLGGSRGLLWAGWHLRAAD